MGRVAYEIRALQATDKELNLDYEILNLELRLLEKRIERLEKNK